MTRVEADSLMELIAKHGTLKGFVKERGGEVVQFTLTGALTIPEPFLVYDEVVRRLREAGVKVPTKESSRTRQLNRRQMQLRALAKD